MTAKIKNIINLIVISAMLFILLNGNAAGTVTWELNNNVLGNTAFNTMFQMDEQHFCAGAGSRGEVYCTDDGGQTWDIRVNTGADVQSIRFATSQTGWAVSGFEGFGVSGYLGRTTDGGRTWVDYMDNLRTSVNSQYTIPIGGISVIDENIAYARGLSAWGLYVTKDGGQTWAEIEDPTNGDYYNGGYSIGFKDASNGFVLTERDIYKTSDGGASWESFILPWKHINPESQREYWHAVSSTEVFAVIRDSGEYIIYHTADSGAFWEPVYTSTEPIVSVYFMNSNEGYIGGDNYIAHSTDGGYTWSTEYEGDGMVYFRKGLEDMPFVYRWISGWGVGGYYRQIEAATPVELQYIWIEAEDEADADYQTPGTEWDTREENPSRREGHSGTGNWYLSREGDMLTYDVNIPESGNYMFWLRDESDSAHPYGARGITIYIDETYMGSFNENPNIATDDGKAHFGWQNLMEVNLAAGAHTVDIIKTETTSAASLPDAMLFTNDADFVPTGTVPGSVANDPYYEDEWDTSDTQTTTTPTTQTPTDIMNERQGQRDTGVSQEPTPPPVVINIPGFELVFGIIALLTGHLFWRKK